MFKRLVNCIKKINKKSEQTFESYDDVLNKHKKECKNHDKCKTCPFDNHCLIGVATNPRKSFLAGQRSIKLVEGITYTENI